GGRAGPRPVAPARPPASEGPRRLGRPADAEVMPPPATGKKLTPRQVELLRRWITSGADYAQHWALVPPVRPPLPKVINAARVRTPVDAFVLARLEREGLRPAPEAGKETLLRRLSLDLTGLPPTPDEIDAFLA